jgi:hypothetical protein
LCFWEVAAWGRLATLDWTAEAAVPTWTVAWLSLHGPRHGSESL